jgi:hypothetical protein
MILRKNNKLCIVIIILTVCQSTPHSMLSIYFLNLEIQGPLESTYHRFSRLALNSLEFDVLVVIMRTARCARFVQSRAVVGVSNKINWFRFCRLLVKINPCQYYYLWKMKRHESLFGVTEEDEENITPAGGERQSIEGTQILSTEVEKKACEKRERENLRRQGVWDKMAFVGIGKDRKLAIKREASTKIQRAWRKHVRFEFDGEWGDIVRTNCALAIRELKSDVSIYYFSVSITKILLSCHLFNRLTQPNLRRPFDLIVQIYLMIR